MYAGPSKRSTHLLVDIMALIALHHRQKIITLFVNSKLAYTYFPWSDLTTERQERKKY